MSEEQEILNGVVESITFKNENNGWAVIEVATGEEFVTVVGVLNDINVGENCAFYGEWANHPTFGRQFKAQKYQTTLPSDAAGMLRFLSGGIISGVREATASKIVETFGSDTFNIIENHPEELAKIKGITQSKAKKISQSFKMQFLARETMNKLIDLGLTQKEAYDAYDMFKAEAYDIIVENPYALIKDNGLTFDRADEIALSFNNQVDFSYRFMAGVTYVVKYNINNGHTCVPRDALAKTSKKMLDCTDDDVEIAIDNAIETGQLVSENINEREFIFDSEIYNAEKTIAQRIKVMLSFPPSKHSVSMSDILTYESINKITFDEKQRQAIEIAVNKGILILTGGPGTGKTTTIRGMISLMESMGLKVALSAPTGRAAKRMTELTGREAKTIHRLLEVQYRDGENEPKFVHNIKNPLDCDAVIIDELSMVDVRLFASLLDALPLSCRLIMVGDNNQLPPVGAGNVLLDLIKSEMIDVVFLDKIFRQALESNIISNAHRIVNGEMPVFDNSPSSDFFFLKEDSKYKAPSKIVNLVVDRIPAGYGYDSLKDIQVICPSRKGEIGSENLNFLLQNALNPVSKDKNQIKFKGYTLREGDKVMQIKNNYDVPWFKSDENGTGVFNGDIGILTNIDKENDIINVRFDDKEAMYSIANANEIELAYAMTTHKSQGSEFDAVVLPILDTQPLLAYRNLIYTAITRAKGLIVIVGNEISIKKMVDNNKKSRRYSALSCFLKQDDEF